MFGTKRRASRSTTPSVRFSNLRRSSLLCLLLTVVFLCSLVGPADSVDSRTSHQQNPREEQEPPEGERRHKTQILPSSSTSRGVHTVAVALQHKTGLPISTYFSAVKLRWLMDNVDEVHEAVVSHRAMFGTVDSWLIWVSEDLLLALDCRRICSEKLCVCLSISV